MKQKHASNQYLTGAMVLSMFLWGLSWPSGKVLTRYCSAVNFTVYRYLFVVLTMLLLIPLLGFNFRLRKKALPSILASGILLAVYSYLFFLGIKNGHAGAGGVLVTTLNPIMAYAIGFGLKRTLPSRQESLGLLLGLIAGIILLKIWDNHAMLDGGNLYFLLASITWAAMSKFTANGALHGSSVTFSLWQYTVTLLCLLPFVNFAELQAAKHIHDSLFWLNLLFGSVIVTAMATTVYFYTTTRLGAERASSFIFLVPFAAELSAWAFLGEKILLHTVIGGLLGIAAVYTINKKKKPAIAK